MATQPAMRSGLRVNPFSPAAGAVVTGPAGGGTQDVQRSPTQTNQNIGDIKTSTTGVVPDKTNKDTNVDDPAKAAKGDDLLSNLDKFWDNEPDDPNKPKPKVEPIVPQLDPKALLEQVGKHDFTKSIKPETFAAMAKGGDEAASAFAEALNSVVRQSVALTYTAANKMLTTAMGNAETQFAAKIPEHVRTAIVNNNLQSGNKLMSLPQFQPLVDVVRERFQTKYPKANPAQIEKGVSAYFDEMVKTATAKDDKQEDATVTNANMLKSGNPDADFLAWAGLDEQQ